MRIALVGPTHPYKGGIAYHTNELAHRLTDAGHDVEVVSWSAQYPSFLYPGQQRVVSPEGVPFRRTSYPLSWRRPDTWWRTGRRLRRDADAVVVAAASPVQAPAYSVLLRAARGGPRRLVLCHNVLPHERRGVDEALTRRLLRGGDAVLAHSSEEGCRARALTSVPVFSVPLPPMFSVVGGGSAVTRTTRPRRTLLFFGLVRAYKGLDVLLRAMPEVPSDVRLLVVGEFWGGVEQFRALVTELGISDRVELRPGYLPAEEIPALFSSVDALVLPYRASSSSQNVYIAFEYGLPVVATRVGTLPDHVRDGVDGLLCAADDPHDLAKAITRVYDDDLLTELRAGVRSPDAGPAWQKYMHTLLGAVSPPFAAEPTAEQRDR